jgi:holo-ACP synthase
MNNGVTLFDEHQHCITKIQQQKRLLSQYRLPLVIISTLTPKLMAQSTLNQQLFDITYNAAIEVLKKHQCRIVDQEYGNGNVRKECTLVIQGMSASELKHEMIIIENHHSIGRLMNLDVIDSNGKTISRSTGQLKPRQCLICERAAIYCTTHHRHSDQEIEKCIIHHLDQVLAVTA